MDYLLADSIENISHFSKRQLTDKMCDAQKLQEGSGASPSEKRSWENSLYTFIKLLQMEGLGHLYIVAEYSLIGNDRIDAVLVGKSKYGEGKPLATIIELKQWSRLGDNNLSKKAFVKVKLYNEVYEYRLHPIQQTINYQRNIKGHHSEVHNNKILVNSIQYLHNYNIEEKYKFFEDEYEQYKGKESSLFVYGDKEKNRLVRFLHDSYLEDANHEDSFDLFLKGQYVFGQSGFEGIKNILEGKLFASMIDDQNEISIEIFKLLKKFSKKPEDTCIIVSGSAGTGKTYIGMNAIRSALHLEQYFNTENVIFTLSRNKTLKDIIDTESGRDKSWPYLYKIKPDDKYKLIVVDEAHRIEYVEKNINEIFQSEEPKIVIFLQDDRQRVNLSEKGTCKEISSCLNRKGIPNFTFELNSQKRSGNQGNYVNEIQQLLYGTEYELNKGNSEFEVNTSLSLLEIDKKLRLKDSGLTSKWYAPFNWEWGTENLKNITSLKAFDNIKFDISIQDNGFEFNKYWNPKNNQYDWYKGKSRIIRSIDGSRELEIAAIDQVGCVHTAQGLDYDYVGFIWFKDLYWDQDKSEWAFRLDVSEDRRFKNSANSYIRSNNNSKESINNVLEIILNQYYILLTRARKGIYIWFHDEITKRKFESIVSS